MMGSLYFKDRSACSQLYRAYKMYKRIELASSTSQLYTKSFAVTSFPQYGKLGMPLELSEIQQVFAKLLEYFKVLHFAKELSSNLGNRIRDFLKICSQMSVPTVNLKGLRLYTSIQLGFHLLSNFVCVGGKLQQHLPTTYWLLAQVRAVSLLLHSCVALRHPICVLFCIHFQNRMKNYEI